MSQIKDSKNKYYHLIIVLIFFVSAFVSFQTINYPYEWLTAQSLNVIRSFDDWGFWKLKGLLVITPHSYEYQQVNIFNLTKYEGIYVSYPSIYLMPFYLLLKLFQINIQDHSVLIRVYNLLIDRFFFGFILFYLYLECVPYFLPPNTTALLSRPIALLGSASWLLSPPCMYWSQDIFNTDQAIICPVTLLILLSVKNKFSLNQVALPHQLLFAAVVFYSALDWYGWVACGFLMFIFTFEKLITSPTLLKEILSDFASFKKYASEQIFSCWPIYVPLLIVSVVFAIQLSFYTIGFDLFFSTGWSWSLFTNSGDWKGLSERASNIYSYLLPYLSQTYLFIVNPKLDRTNFLSVGVLLANIFLLRFCFFDKRMNTLILSSFYIMPIVQMAILFGHSSVHPFSVFKLSVGIVFATVIIPILIAVNMIYRGQPVAWVRGFSVLFFASTFLLTFAFTLRCWTNYQTFVPGPDTFTRDFGTLVRNHTEERDLVLTDNFEIYPWPPTPLWYSGKLAYRLDRLSRVTKVVGIEKIREMNPVYIDLKTKMEWEKPINPEIQEICQDQWVTLADKISENRDAIACRAPELKALVEKWSLKAST